MGRSYLPMNGEESSGPADGAGEIGQTEARPGQRPELQEGHIQEAEHPDRPGDDVAPGYGPALPAQSPGEPRTGDPVDERKQDQRAHDDPGDDLRHDQLRTELQELTRTEEIP